MSTPRLVTCPCQNCNGHIQFDAVTLARDNNKITCPHCGLETILFVPPPTDAKMQTILSPASPSPVISPLIKCPACSSEISPAAASCPRCGHPVRKINWARAGKLSFFVGLVAAGFWVIYMGGKSVSDATLQGIVDADKYKQSNIELSNTLRNLAADASNNAAIRAKQLADTLAAQESTAKIKRAEDVANIRVEGLYRVADATKAAAVSHIKLLRAQGILNSNQVPAETEKRIAAIDRVVEREMDGEISLEQAYAEFERISSAFPER